LLFLSIIFAAARGRENIRNNSIHEIVGMNLFPSDESTYPMEYDKTVMTVNMTQPFFMIFEISSLVFINTSAFLVSRYMITRTIAFFKAKSILFSILADE